MSWWYLDAMDGSTVKDIKRTIIRIIVGIAAVFAMLALLLSMLWRDRVRLSDIPIPSPPRQIDNESAVTVTWFGVTTLLFDDGETQILIDGFVSRPTLLDILAQLPVENDAAMINYFLNEFRIRRLAAIIPVHSHFDHAMDIGAIANRSSASILGSEATAQIGHGAGVPEDQIVIISDGAEYTFGRFTVRFIESVHAPVGWGGSVPLTGTIDEPLLLPAPVTAFREGGCYSILISHPQGSTLIQGSAGVRESALDGLQVDTVMLGVGLLEGLGRDYIENYWQKTVTATGARIVIPVHFDDYTRPFGRIELAPRLLDNFLNTAKMLEDIRSTWDIDAKLYLPEFAVPFELYPSEDPEA